MRTIATIVILLIAGSLCPGQEQSQQTVDLQPKLIAGRSSVYEFWTLRQQNVSQQLMGHQRTVHTQETVNGRITWRIAKVRHDGSADCEMTFEWIAVEYAVDNGPSGKADSRQGGGDWEDGNNFVKAMAGKTLNVRVQADGSIGKVTGFKAINQAIGREKDTYDERDFQEAASYLATLVAAPAEATVGQSWSNDLAWNHEMGQLNLVTTWTLDDAGDLSGVPVAMVSGSSKVKMDFKKPDLGSDAPPVDMKLDSGERYEQVVFDLSRGEVAARNATQNLNTTVTIRLPQGSLVQKTEESVQDQLVRVEEEE